MFYLHDVAEGSNRSSANDKIASSDDDGVLDDDCWEFGSAASSELEDEERQESTSPRPHDGASSGVELAPPAFGLPSVVEATDSDPIDTAPADEERIPPHGKSIAHFDLHDGNIVFLSLDLETGGEYCGIVQLSGQLFRQNMADKHHMTFIAVEDTFNEYVRPPDGAFWNEEACRQSHGLTAQSPQIRNGLPFTTVWTNFCTWIQENVGPSEKSNERLTLARSSTSNILLGKIVSKYASYIPLKLVPVVAILCSDLEGVSKAGVHLLHRTLRGTTQDTSMPSTGMTGTQRTTRPPFAQTAGTYVCSFGCLIGVCINCMLQ